MQNRRKYDSPANESPEAVALRQAAIAFARGLNDPVSDHDIEGRKRNHALLTAALAYASHAKPSAFLRSVDEAIGVLLDTYGADLALEDHSEVLWTLIRASCAARRIRPPKALPESGEDWRLHETIARPLRDVLEKASSKRTRMAKATAPKGERT